MLSFASLFENSAQRAKQGAMVAFFVPKNIGKIIHSKFEEIEGDSVEVDYMHITLGLIRNKDIEDKKIAQFVKKTSEQIPPFFCHLSHSSFFEPTKNTEGKYILWVKPQSPMIHKVHKSLLPQLKKFGVKIDNGDFGFSPHITIKYTLEEPPQKKFHLNTKIDHISFCRGDDRKHFRLKG